ncbi:MAG: hypothetical protein LKF75_04620 [Bacilli bacterium]|jgi:hypothetical protein|nr:hypothetical protein [Bacilli bacterium]MCH4228956.1 hypothetical protein [Bacilli bacterium]MCH4278375.1 hypothetical protein [Bacilli bacterium]
MGQDKRAGYESYLAAVNTLRSLIRKGILEESDYPRFEPMIAEKYGLGVNSIYRKSQLDKTSF